MAKAISHSSRTPLRLLKCIIYSHDIRSLLRSNREPREERMVEETVSSIRARTRHNDPYEEWERNTRKDAFVSVLTL